MRKKLPIIFYYWVFLCNNSFAQTQEIRGTVVSAEDDAPIPGVSILVKGANIGTVSEFRWEILIGCSSGK